jgi:PAS domain S-box-containing protein
MIEDDKIKSLQRERDYLSARLEETSKELARLDLLNLILTQQKGQAIAAFNFIKIMQEKIEESFSVDELYWNVVKTLTNNFFMDSSAVLRIDFNTRDIFILASSGLKENLKYLKLDENISKKEVLTPTFVNSKSFLYTLHTFVVNNFRFPYFVWYPIADEEAGLIILFVGNNFEDLVLKQPFTDASLETFGAISSVILLRREYITKTQEILRNKEDKINFLAEILKTSPISVIATDLDVKITYVNPATEKLYGYKSEELIGKDPGLLNAESNSAEIQKEISDTVRQGKLWRGEIMNRKKNGDLFYIHASIYPVLDREENFIAFVGFHEDITEHKKAEGRLLEEKNFTDSLINSLPGNFYLVNENRRVLRWNQNVEINTGYSAEEISRMDSLDFFAGEGKKLIEEKILEVFLKGESSAEVDVISKDGRKNLYLLTGVRFISGGQKYLVGVGIDIDERKRAEEALQESEKKYRDLVNNALVGIYKTNLKGDILYVNEALSKMLEFESPEDMMAEGVSSRYKNSKDREFLIENLKERNRVESFELELLTKTGKTKYVLLSAILDGDVISGMIMDITMRKHLFEQVQVKQEHLQSLSRRLMEVQETDRRFLASELHDQIGQNLTALGMNLNIIRSQFSKEVDKKIVDQLEDSMKLVEETIERMRDVMAGLRPPVLDDYGLMVALRWYTERFSERTGVATILQERQLSPRLPLVVETELFRIVQEVLTNVAKHADARQAIITLERVDGMVQLVISDDGVGFNSAVLRQLKEQPGWGLITIEERARALGGDLSVESLPGKGTKVIVKVPR